ncbi:CHAP domain-containing protein [Pseudoroseomonas globiformis]|uniref:CHAP domain-containing protein n=1 Tax=Teichococcus globiformis TaxID=2307229 RepID=A0ABV7FZD0_9PROT
MREATKQPRISQQHAALRSAKSQHVKLNPTRRAAVESSRVALGEPGPISCVPYVRAVTGMGIIGNAHTWWSGAESLYARGQVPEPGAVLSFRSSGGMRLGHVAVVSRVEGKRELRIDHSNWEGPGIRKGTVMKNVSVIDVSERNDWTAVRVQIGHSDAAYGRVYATNGFIYNRAPGSTPAPLMTAGGSGAAAFEEVAESASGSLSHAAHLTETMRRLNLDASLR